MRVGLLHNPHARRSRGDRGLLNDLTTMLATDDCVEAPDGRDAVDAAVARLDAEVIAINGGDGTVHTALTALARRGDVPTVALLNGGTMNTSARGVGVRGSPRQILKYVVDNRQSLPTVRRTLLEAQVERDGQQQRLFGFMWGAGIWARYIELYDESAWPSGPVAAAAVLGRGFVSTFVGGPYIRRMTQRIQAKVTVDGTPWPIDDFAVLAAGTTDEVGLGFRPFYDVLDHPDHIQVVGMGSSIVRVALELWQVWWGRPFKHPDNHNALTRRLEIEATEPVTFSFDGDIHRVGPRVVLQPGPTVDIVVPEW